MTLIGQIHDANFNNLKIILLFLQFLQFLFAISDKIFRVGFNTYALKVFDIFHTDPRGQNYRKSAGNVS